ncbi:conserved unknown protein [Ectocarpus siliculosus]|uniref:26S proteasome non-ATPase regulatory subunit 9 n=1 Tax=Ectocarpus siliculosus TaxID=2880 RepID=D8LKY7_ECTSI|nr:conserved unknown protein [Ectocarpus siliculosus]|eukprot:CBN80120.1 conserved unknown protein [Ectocarpus siliculosus]
MSAFAKQQQQPIPSPEEALRKELVMLQAQRDALELEADAIASELKSPGANGEAPVGVKGALVDSDGFPLAGFDLFNVRERRHRFNCIQTDHKAVMSRIEKSLHALHDARLARPTPLPAASSVTAATPPTPSLVGGDSAAAASMSLAPIAKVNQVSEGSPASAAGLAVGDLVLRFGRVDISHPKGLGGVVDVVREKEGQEVPVTVLRTTSASGGGGSVGTGGGVRELTLVPKTWSGRGLLGVHLLPP